ncbi:MAG: T9SS type A sorting domain-containing protein [Ignavibacteriaceae bacterium]
MKKLSIFLMFLLLNATLLAQTYFDVQPGYGTLNDAITANQGNVIYRLQAGQWYGLSGQIENNGFALTIVGTTPAAGQMPAEIQTATLPDGTVLANLFSVLGDLTLKNVFIVNADANNTEGGNSVISVNDATPNKVVLDSVTVDPVGLNGGLIAFNATPHPKLFLTNCLFLRMGMLDGANDGWFWSIGGAPNNGFDTLYLENNTFLSTGTGMGMGAGFNTDSENVVWINHNSFIFHKSPLFWAWHMNSYFVTNNLFFDFHTQPWSKKWNVYFPDGDTAGSQSVMALINQDTTSYDSTNGKLLSQRKLFVEYNSLYLDPRIQAYATTWPKTHTLNNDGVTPLDTSTYFMQLGYPSDSANVNREANMYGSASFPYFKFGNYLKQIDPQWTDPKFYAIQDSLVNWTLPAAELNTWGFSANNVNPQPNQAGNWFWNSDTVYNYGNPEVWPRVDCSYKNSTLLTASIEGLPLGDLNWFPAAKAIWQKNQAAIMAHIVSENTSVLNVTDVKKENNQTPTAFTLSQNYPNPFNPSTVIKYSIPKSGIVTLKVYNMLGQEVATLVNQMQNSGNYIVNFNADKLASGVYMYRIQSGDFTLTKKMELLK